MWADKTALLQQSSLGARDIQFAMNYYHTRCRLSNVNYYNPPTVAKRITNHNIFYGNGHVRAQVVAHGHILPQCENTIAQGYTRGIIHKQAFQLTECNAC